MRNHLSSMTAAMLCALLLNGCDMLREQTDIQAQRTLGPEKLDGGRPDGKYNGMTFVEAIGAEPPKQQAWLGAAVMDSLQKCQAFTARLGLLHGGYDLALDITTLALAGAASVTVPARAANTLAAIAGIAAGTRTALDTDIYQQNTAPLIVQQINKTYYPEMKAYLASFPPGNLIVPVEFARISQYHADCSLPMALAQLGTGQSSRPLITTSDLAANAVFTAPNGPTVTIGAQNADKTRYWATITPTSGGAGATTSYTNDVLIALLNGLSATKTK